VNVIVAIPELPSATEASAIDIVGGASSSTIVALPVASAMDALDAFVRLTRNVSSFSSRRSGRIGTSKVCEVTLGPNVSVPDVVV
jgi:hypothetical protein